MKPKMIGILGGAGPLAGASLLERLVTLAGSGYGCYRDADYPKIFLLSYPFTEMLTADLDAEKVREELKESLKVLRQNGCEVIAIACNTLYAFLDREDDLTDLVHLPRAVGKVIPESEIPLVLCTTTSARYGIHKQYFPCVYPDPKTQVEIDTIIDRVLKGEDMTGILTDLIKVLQEHTSTIIILGCTELSLFSGQLSSVNKVIIDPLNVVGSELLKISFSKR